MAWGLALSGHVFSGIRGRGKGEEGQRPAPANLITNRNSLSQTVAIARLDLVVRFFLPFGQLQRRPALAWQGLGAAHSVQLIVSSDRPRGASAAGSTCEYLRSKPQI